MDDQWYAYVWDATGEVATYATGTPGQLPEGYVAIPVDHQPGAGEHWDPVARAIVADQDPALGGQDDWYVYVDDAGAIRGGGSDPTAPAGLEAVKLTSLPTGNEDWDPHERAFVVHAGVRSLLLRTMVPALLARLETIEALQDRLPGLALAPDAASIVGQDLADRRMQVLGLLALALGDYAQAAA